LLLLFYTNFY